MTSWAKCSQKNPLPQWKSCELWLLILSYKHNHTGRGSAFTHSPTPFADCCLGHGLEVLREFPGSATNWVYICLISRTILSQSWRPRDLNQDIGWTVLSLKLLGKDLFLIFLLISGYLIASIVNHCITPILLSCCSWEFTFASMMSLYSNSLLLFNWIIFHLWGSLAIPAGSQGSWQCSGDHMCC